MIIDLLKQVSKQLDDKGFEYMLSGSLAMNIYTTPRMTRDIDIVINLNNPDISKFVEIFRNGFYLYEEGIETEIKNRGMFNIIDNTSGVKIDFIIRKNSKFHLNEFKRRKKVSYFGFDVWVVSKEDLIISKLKWIQDLQSDTQLNDIKNLLSIDDMDREYVKYWCEELNLQTYGVLKNE
ncbi:MAG: DUF6036 family nucleotidyltransferase [Balneolaceae bacterium]